MLLPHLVRPISFLCSCPLQFQHEGHVDSCSPEETIQSLHHQQIYPPVANYQVHPSIAHSLDMRVQTPNQTSYLQSFADDAPPTSQILQSSHVDQSPLSHATVPRHSSAIESRSTSSDETISPSRHEFKDWSPAGDWHLQKAFRGHAYYVSRFAFSHDGKSIVSGSEDCTIRVWDFETGDAVGQPMEGHTASVFCVAFSPDDRRIVSGSFDRTIRIWDAQTGDQLFIFEEHGGLITSVAFSSDGRRVVSSDLDRNVLIWDVDSSSNSRRLEEPKHSALVLYFSADDRYLVGTYGKRLSVWDVESGKLVSASHQGLKGLDFAWVSQGALYTLINGGVHEWNESEKRDVLYSDSALSPDRRWIAIPFADSREFGLYSRDPPPEELASVDDIEDYFRRLWVFCFCTYPSQDCTY